MKALLHKIIIPFPQGIFNFLAKFILNDS